MRAFLVLLLAVLFVPALAVAMAVWPFVDILETKNPGEIIEIGRFCLVGEGLDSEFNEACALLNQFSLLGLGASLVAGLGVGLITVSTLVAVTTGWSRFLLSFSFPVTAFFAILLISVITLGQAVLAAAALYYAESYFFGVVHPWVIGVVAVVGGGVALTVLLNVISMFRTATTSVIGIAVQPVEAPHIHRVVMNIARELNTRPPKNIVLGFDPTFFATSAKVSIPFLDRPLRGETLYLSLPLLRVFSKTEAHSIIGHELAHFSGADTIFSKKFAPAYRGLDEARSNLAGQDGKASIWSLPATITLNFVLSVFSRAERRINRSRELRADQVGARIGSPESLSSALIKFSILAQIWQLEFDNMVERIRKGRFSRNLSRNFTERARFDVDHDKVAGLAALGLESEVQHPTDTHPTTRVRIETLGMNPEEFVDHERFKLSLLPDETIIAKSDSIDGIEERLTDAYQQLILHFTDSADSDEHNSDNAFSNLLSLWLARMASIDGEVDDSEIEVAQEEAFKFDPSFDPTSFKEHCRHPEDIPTTEKLIYWANVMLTDSGAERLKRILRQIAEADGVIHRAERDLLMLVDEELFGGMRPEDFE